VAADRKSNRLFSNLYDRLFPNDEHPNNHVGVGFNTRMRHEDSQGVVNSAYDIKVADQDGNVGRISNRQLNRMHRVMEAQASVIGGLHELARAQKVQMHRRAFPGSYYSFVETFFDTSFALDTGDICIWNGLWSAPLAPAALDATGNNDQFTRTGSLLHNAHGGYITFTGTGSETADAGSYRSKNLMNLNLPTGSDAPLYTVPNSFDWTLSEADLRTPVSPVTTTELTFADTGVVAVIGVHANAAFWAKGWTGTLDAAGALDSKNRITVYFADGASDADTAKKWIFLPNVPTGHSYAPTTSTDTIFGKLVNLEDADHRPNVDIEYSNSSEPPYWMDIEASGAMELTLPSDLESVATGVSTYLPSALTNDGTGIPSGELDRVSVEVTLGPGARVYSWSIQLMTVAQYAMSTLSSNRT